MKRQIQSLFLKKGLFKYLLVFALFFSISSSTAFARELSVQASTTRDTFTIGEAIEYAIILRYPQDYAYKFGYVHTSPGIEMHTGPLTKTSKLPSENQDELLYTLLALDTGVQYFMPVTIQFKDGRNATYEIATDSVKIYIKAADVDLSKDIKPIISPIGTDSKPLPWELIISAALGLILILLLIWLVIRRPKKTASKNSRLSSSAYDKAMAELKKLRKSEAWKKQEVKEYYSNVTLVLRNYFSAVYDINALDQTSKETLTALQKKNMDSNLYTIAERVLNTADLVKFAKLRPSEDANKEIFEDVRILIETSHKFLRKNEE